MSHPFFDSASYPWCLDEAWRLYDVLTDVIFEPAEIDILYQCQAGLPRLPLNDAPAVIWKQALDNLGKAGALRAFCERLQETAHFRNNQTLQAAIKDVVTAQWPPGYPTIPDRKVVADALAILAVLARNPGFVPVAELRAESGLSLDAFAAADDYLLYECDDYVRSTPGPQGMRCVTQRGLAFYRQSIQGD